MKFDIYNRTTKQAEMGLFADTPQMLKQLYAMNDEDIEIVKVYNEAPQNILTPPNSASVPTLPQIPLPVAIPPALPVQPIENISLSISSLEERFFTDNGVEYKITQLGSFKKSWVDVDQNKFRVVDIETGKESKLKNKKIQTLDWVKIG